MLSSLVARGLLDKFLLLGAEAFAAVFCCGMTGYCLRFSAFESSCMCKASQAFKKQKHFFAVSGEPARS